MPGDVVKPKKRSRPPIPPQQTKTPPPPAATQAAPEEVLDEVAAEAVEDQVQEVEEPVLDVPQAEESAEVTPETVLEVPLAEPAVTSAYTLAPAEPVVPRDYAPPETPPGSPNVETLQQLQFLRDRRRVTVAEFREEFNLGREARMLLENLVRLELVHREWTSGKGLYSLTQQGLATLQG